MVEKIPVSVNWQTLFILIPILDLWATYRIQKLRIYLLIFLLGFGLAAVVLEIVLSPNQYFSDEPLTDVFYEESWEVEIALTIVSMGLAIILIRKWSREWNEKLTNISTPERKQSPDYVKEEDSSIELLKKRYAMGEISKEEFEQMKNDLKNS